jgi:hypothetical protein
LETAMGKWIAPLMMALIAATVSADTVVLKTGQTIEGKVVSNDDKGVVLEVTYGTMLITQDKIMRIEEETAESLAVREKDAEEKRAFAAKMKADGKVLYKGKWVDEKEKQADEDKIAAAKKKKDADIAAKKKAQDDADKKKQDAADKLAQQTPQQLNSNNTRDRRRSRDDRYKDGNTQPNRGSTVDYNSQILDRLRQNGVSGNAENMVKDYLNRYGR